MTTWRGDGGGYKSLFFFVSCACRTIACLRTTAASVARELRAQGPGRDYVRRPRTINSASAVGSDRSIPETTAIAVLRRADPRKKRRTGQKRHVIGRARTRTHLCVPRVRGRPYAVWVNETGQ